MQRLYNIGLHKIQGGFIMYCWELMKSVGSHGNSSLLLVMKNGLWHFVSNSDKVMALLIGMVHVGEMVYFFTFKWEWRFVCNFMEIYAMLYMSVGIILLHIWM
jgi:hypothetical protein